VSEILRKPQSKEDAELFVRVGRECVARRTPPRGTLGPTWAGARASASAGRRDLAVRAVTMRRALMDHVFCKREVLGQLRKHGVALGGARPSGTGGRTECGR